MSFPKLLKKVLVIQIFLGNTLVIKSKITRKIVLYFNENDEYKDQELWFNSPKDNNMK